MSDDPLYMPAFTADLDTGTMQEQRLSVDTSDTDLSHHKSMHPPYEPIPGVPLGLEPLEGIDAIVVQEQLETVEIILEIEMNNCYSIFNQYGQRLFFAAEQSDCCTRFCLGRSRSYVIRMFDSMGKEVMTAERECNCPLCWWGGGVAGSIITIKSVTTGEVLAGGSCFATIMCLEGTFNVFSKTETGEEQIGAIKKNFGLKELITESDNFGIRLPGDLQASLKATLLGAVFCIDYSYYENFYDWPPSGFNCTVLIIIVCICVVLFVVTL
ncbi:unnamed protein product [Allacma fusca]|uniref:Phospholipid scramblase n=1 Tax=Allacma fusca TaxID=39272 RepID=A0A8J2JD46_9HEXA|nr:unnamed protein product [Allacma fusca]